MRQSTAFLIASVALATGLAMGTVAHRLQPGGDGAGTAAACPAGATPRSRLDLVFGLARKDGAPISADEWQAFLDAEITPRFSDGLTVFDGAGQWRGPDGKLVKEPSRTVVIWYTPTAASMGNIDAIRRAYVTRFNQDSVLRVDDGTSCVSF